MYIKYDDEALDVNTLRSPADVRVVYTTDAKQLHLMGTIIYSRYRILNTPFFRYQV